MGERVRDGGGGTAQRRTYSPCHAGQDSLPRRAGGQLSPPAPSLTGRLSVRAQQGCPARRVCRCRIKLE